MINLVKEEDVEESFNRVKEDIQYLHKDIATQRYRIDWLVALLEQILTEKQLAKKLKKNKYISNILVEDYPTVKQFLIDKIDP